MQTGRSSVRNGRIIRLARIIAMMIVWESPCSLDIPCCSVRRSPTRTGHLSHWTEQQGMTLRNGTAFIVGCEPADAAARGNGSHTRPPVLPDKVPVQHRAWATEEMQRVSLLLRSPYHTTTSTSTSTTTTHHLYLSIKASRKRVRCSTCETRGVGAIQWGHRRQTDPKSTAN